MIISINALEISRHIQFKTSSSLPEGTYMYCIHKLFTYVGSIIPLKSK